MKTKYLLVILSTPATALIIILFLAQFSYRTNSNKNGFTRKLVSNKIIFVNKTYIDHPVYNIIDLSKDYIYLSIKDIRILTRTNYLLNRFDTIKIPINFTPVYLMGATMKINYPNFIFFINNFSSLYFYKFGDTIFYSRKLEPPLYTRSALLSPVSISLRAFDSTRSKQIFEKISIQTGKILKKADIINPQKDAGFSSDGMLNYDTVSNLLSYVQYYSNQFFILDTNLNLKLKSRTIDTTTSTPISTRSFIKENKSGSLLPAVPLSIVNKEAVSYNGKLLILSNLQADNEDKNTFNKNSTIDVYNINTGKYEYSTYIPDIDREKLINFKINGDRLVALYKNYIAIFKFTI